LNNAGEEASGFFPSMDERRFLRCVANGLSRRLLVEWIVSECDYAEMRRMVPLIV
jgi:hypothetical protein